MVQGTDAPQSPNCDEAGPFTADRHGFVHNRQLSTNSGQGDFMNSRVAFSD